jgi:hypothetical protein
MTARKQRRGQPVIGLFGTEIARTSPPIKLKPGSVRLTFGAYKGARIDETPPEYLRWALKAFKDLWPFQRDAMEAYLQSLSEEGG